MIAAWCLAVALGVPTPLCVSADHTLCSVGLNKGDYAPFMGQLLTPALALKVSQKATGCKTRMQALKVKYESDAAISATKSAQLRAADLALWREDLHRCKQATQRAQQESANLRAWYRSPWLWAPAAAIVSGGVVGFAVAVASR